MAFVEHGRTIAAEIEGSGDPVRAAAGRSITSAARALERAHERFQLDVLASQNQRLAQ